ncbi:MAG: hypothetical protein M3N52_05860 [Actinomycetota bacterium]|nr:hypothetical protein [Actinomycetota bacterium]
MTDRLTRLQALLDGLADQPLAAHPRILDEVHRALVAELEALAGAGQAGGDAA